MSRGLGKLQTEIMATLEQQSGGTCGLGALVKMLHFHDPDIYGCSEKVSEREVWEYEPTTAFYQSVSRAVRSLKRCGLVATEKRSMGNAGEQGGHTYWLEVKSLVHGQLAKK